MAKFYVTYKSWIDFLERLSIFTGHDFAAQFERDTESAAEALSNCGNRGKGEDERPRPRPSGYHHLIP